MKIKRGDSVLMLPPHGQILGVRVKYEEGGEARWRSMDHVYQETIRRQQMDNPGILGCPWLYTISGSQLRFYPAASADMEMRIRYYPEETEV